LTVGFTAGGVAAAMAPVVVVAGLAALVMTLKSTVHEP
jgi:hypothetical protein